MLFHVCVFRYVLEAHLIKKFAEANKLTKTSLKQISN